MSAFPASQAQFPQQSVETSISLREFRKRFGRKQQWSQKAERGAGLSQDLRICASSQPSALNIKIAFSYLYIEYNTLRYWPVFFF